MVENDVQLIHRILAGNDAAFTALVRKYQKSVHALAWRKVGDFHYAEEITQDTFLQVYKQLSTLKDPRQFSGWLYVITNRRCLNWIRDNKSALQSLEMTTMQALDKSAYARYVSEQREAESAEHRQNIVKRLLEKLPESERTVMTLYYLGEMTTKEIGRFLGVSVNTITSRLQRAKRRLQQDEERLVQGILGRVQLPDSLAENIVRGVADMKLAPSPTGKPLLPWAALGTAAILVLLLLGLSNKYLSRFQRPYSFEAASEPTIEIIEAPVVLETKAKPAQRNQVGRATTTGKISSAGLHGSETVSTPRALVHPEGTEPWMPDPALRAVVREALALPAVVPLTKERLLQLRHLNAGGKGITDLKGLEFAHNLVDLHLGNAGNYITDLRPLATLISLTNLNVGGNQVADLKPLANLTHLTGLSLWNNRVTDVSPLSSLTALTYLNLADNYVSDLRPLAHLIHLEELDLFDNEVVTIAPITDLKNLNHLILTDNHIQDFSPLAELTQMEALWIKGNPIEDLWPLSELSLTDLKYDAIPDSAAPTHPSEAWMPDPALRAAIRGELGLLPEAFLTKEEMPRLDYLNAGDKGILDITGLAFATNLRELHLSMNPITDLRPLASLTSLESLHLCKVSPDTPNLDIRPFASLGNLEVLSLDKSRISDISPLANLKKLRRLHLRHNQIVDIRPLAGLTQLSELTIEGNPITDLMPLSKLNLRELDISNNPLIDLRPLVNLGSLEGLFLENSQITDIRPLSGLRKLRILDIRYNAIEDLRPLSGLTTLQTLLMRGNPVTDLTPLSKLNLTNLKYDAVPESTQETDTVATWMPDVALRTAVRGELGLLPSVLLTKENILQLQVLNVSDKAINNITGLEFAMNLRELDLNRNPITDLRPLADLTKLDHLHLSNVSPNTPNLDLRPLTALINLEVLSLENSQITDIRPLAGLKRLRTLELSYNDISDIRSLAGLTQLPTLWIKGNPIKDLQPLTELNLRDLKYDAVAEQTPQTQASEAWMPDPALRAAIRGELGLLPGVPLTKEEMLRLEYLNAEGKGIPNITGLASATNLRELHLNKNPITDLRPLVNLTKLEILHIRDVAPTAVNLDIYPLGNLINLKKLTLQRNGISDIRPLSGLTRLRTLEIEGNPITDLSPLFGLNLRELDLSNNPLTDLRQLANLTSLEYLCLENSQISDIRPLAGLKRLRILDIRYNAVENIHPLAGLVALQRLWIQGNPITDLSPLSGLPLTDFRHDQVYETPKFKYLDR